MITQSILKEFRLIFSDLHSIAVLFVMPLLFMVIMTFALSNQSEDITKGLGIRIESNEDSEAAQLFRQYLENMGYSFTQDSDTEIEISLSENFGEALFQSNRKSSQESAIDLRLSERVSPQISQLINQHLQLSLARTKLHLYLLDTGDISADLPQQEQRDIVLKQTDNAHLIQTSEHGRSASAISHSIPSWLVFGIFFIVLPLSITLVNEHKSGTLIRIKTFPISNKRYFSVKLLTFLIISFLQASVLTVVGFSLVPMLVDEPGASIISLVTMLPFLLVVCASAVTFGAFIATKVSSYEQAIVLGGGVNIILAALSGLMVPLDIMPQQMQTVAQFSPMYWASAGLRDIYLNNAASLTTPTAALVIFSTICCIISFRLFDAKIGKLVWN